MNTFELGATPPSDEPMQFWHFMSVDLMGSGPSWPCWERNNDYVNDFDNIILLARDHHSTGNDLMYGWKNGERDKGRILLGLFNSGKP